MSKRTPSFLEDEGGEDGEEPEQAPPNPSGVSSGRFKASGTGSGRFKASGKHPAKRKRRSTAGMKAVSEAGTSDVPVFRAGIPIALKIALLSTVLVAGVMIVFGTITYRLAKDELDRETNRRGVLAARIVADTFDPVFWEVPDHLKRDLKLLQEQLAVAVTDHERAEIQQRIDDERKFLENIWNEEEKPRAIDIWDARFAAMVKARGLVIDVRVEDESGKPYALGRADSMRLERSALDVKDVDEDVEAYEGYLVGADQSRTRVRQYVAPLPSKKGKAHIYLNANRIDEVGADVLGRIALSTAIGIGVAVVLSFLAAGLISGPIRALVKDMQIVSAGKLDHRTTAQSRDEIGMLASTFNIMTQSLKAARQAELSQKAMEHELSIATEIQTKLLPERIPQIPGFDIASYYLSAKEVGGDYYDYIVVDKTHLGIVVADVSGKGIPGSMVMTMARSLLRLASHRNTSPADTLKKVNRILAKDMRRGMFVTALYMVLDVQRKVARICSAGHNPLVYYNAKTGDIELLNPAGIALGFDKGPIFESNVKEDEVQLNSGDRLVSYTDGVVEAMNEDNEEFGDEAFYDLVRQNARLSSKDFVSAITTALEHHRGKAEQSDDITITTLAVE